MNSFEINKIVAAVIVTVLIVFGIGKISDVIFYKDSNVVAYKVEAPEGSSVQTSTESSVDMSTFLAMGDVATGEKQFKKCKACHSINKDGRNNNNPQFTDHCFTGDYPTDLKDYKDEKIQEQLSLLSDGDINI